MQNLDPTQAAHKLIMSDTFQRLAQLADSMPTDTSDTESLKAASAKSCVGNRNDRFNFCFGR